MIYGYNIIRFKNHRLTKKMVFIPFILFPTIIDNIYDYVTGGDVRKFDTESIVALLIIMSILYTALYTYDAYIGGKEIAYKPLSQDDEEETGIQMVNWRRDCSRENPQTFDSLGGHNRILDGQPVII